MGQITAIWAGTVPTCTKTVGSTHHAIAANNWACLIPATTLSSTEYTAVNKPIDCYIPQSGSGTAGTWAGDFGYTKSETTGGCLSDAQGDGRSTQGAASHINLFENTMSQIASGKINGHTNNDQANAIYFYSYGKFKATCTGITAAKTSPIDRHHRQVRRRHRLHHRARRHHQRIDDSVPQPERHPGHRWRPLHGNQ